MRNCRSRSRCWIALFFTNGLTGWESIIDTTAIATISVISGQAKATITNGGAEGWMVSLTQGPLNIVNSSTYTVKFDAKADGARTIHAFAGQNVDPWDVYSNYDQFSLTQAMQTYSFTFQMLDPSDSAAVLEFDFGTSDIDVYIDNISMIKQ